MTGCALCGEQPAPLEHEGERYCSPGCRQVGTELGTGGVGRAETDSSEPESGTAGVHVYLHVDGMHCATCEAFLERLANARDGVIGAAASYVTETIRVEYDPESVTPEELAEALTRVGYSVTPREELATVADEHERRPDDRHLDDLLGFRYAAGVLFGLFMLLPYIVVVYPAQISGYLGLERMDLFAGGAGPGDAMLILPLFLSMTSVVLFFTGLPLLRGAYVSLVMRQPNTDLLVTITIVSAYVYGTIAFLAGDLRLFYDLTIVIAAVVVAAIFYESLSKRLAVDLLTELTVSQVEQARRYEPDGTTTTVDIGELRPDDRVLVRQGERIPVDGILDEGVCTVDESVVTGESLPVRKESGDQLIGGAVVTDNVAVFRVGDPPRSRIDGLTTAVWDLQSSTHGIQRQSDRLAVWTVPVLAVLAVGAGLWSLAVGNGVLSACFAVLGTLLVLSPWGVGLSTPLSVARSIRAGIDRGIVIFDETVFERLRETDIVVFDKTGTLTTGEMSVLETDAPADLLAASAELEQQAAHPAGEAIVAAVELGAQTDGGPTPSASGSESSGKRVRAVRSHSNGIEGTVDGDQLLVGNRALFATEGWTVSEEIDSRAAIHRDNGELPVLLGRDGEAAGLVVLGDNPRSKWKETLDRFEDRDVETVVLTGDDRDAAALFDEHPGVDHVFAGVSPAGKTAAIERLRERGHVTMVGDGTNDGPALAAADLGISLGSGTALASEAADITILDDDLSAVETAFELAERARNRLTQNTALALIFNVIAVSLAVGGLLNPLFVMIAAVGTICLVTGNAFRPLLDEDS